MIEIDLDGVLAKLDFQYRMARLREKVVIKAAWLLPRIVAKWAFMRVMAHATSGPWGMEHPDDVSWGEALRRWDIPHPVKNTCPHGGAPTSCAVYVKDVTAQLNALAPTEIGLIAELTKDGARAERFLRGDHYKPAWETPTIEALRSDPAAKTYYPAASDDLWYGPGR